MTLDILVIIMMIVVSVIWVKFGFESWKDPIELEIPCEECPNYGGSIEICIFKCERCKR